MKQFTKWIMVFIFLFSVVGCTKQEDKQEQIPESKEEANIDSGKAEGESTKIVENTKSIVEETTPPVFSEEDQVVAYFTSVEQEVDLLTRQGSSDTVRGKLKNTFITIVDFLFYDQPIGNVTFSSLTDGCKKSIMTIASRIDSKIEQYFPGYKETIKDTAGKVYTTVSSKMKEWMTKADDKFHEAVGDDTYDAYVQGKEDLKNSFSKAGEVIGDVAGMTKDKVKDWYEKFRDGK